MDYPADGRMFFAFANFACCGKLWKILCLFFIVSMYSIRLSSSLPTYYSCNDCVLSDNIALVQDYLDNESTMDESTRIGSLTKGK